MVDARLESLISIDQAYGRPRVLGVLESAANQRLLDYVAEDPFGAHVFPGDQPSYPAEAFLADLDQQLVGRDPIHLWAYIPTCAYRCRFCQYPVIVVRGDRSQTAHRAAAWAELNQREAELWLERVPNLADCPVGEFNLFGGTPSLLSAPALRRLLGFYRESFGFHSATAVRVEGDPTTLDRETLEVLAELGCTKLSCGVQSFDDAVLRQTGRPHTGQAALDFIARAHEIGFDWISVDLMYGLLDQTVASVARDLRLIRESAASAVVCTKLHLRSYAETRTGVTGVQPAAWQVPAYRDRLSATGHHWPSLGEQYQMRELLTDGLRAAGFVEHPTMYFSRSPRGPEVWKSLMVDQDHQCAEVAIGLGGSSSSRRSEAINQVDPTLYREAVTAGHLPIESATGFSPDGREARAIKMALTSLQPVREDVHHERFGRSLLRGRWRSTFSSLQHRGLVRVDEGRRQVVLTTDGETLVEAIVNTEFES